MEVIKNTLIIALIVVFITIQIRYLFNCNRSFHTHFNAYADEKGYTIHHVSSPKNKDWHRSPFKKKKAKISLIQIKLIGVPIEIPKERFFILHVESKGKKKSMWVKVRIGLIRKPQLTYKSI